ncbi:MAG: methyltransferase domain-containing protein [Desulfobacterium sp.]|nr:methyltransferase domain-containing protein [Desulfobacterium sp.]
MAWTPALTFVRVVGCSFDKYCMVTIICFVDKVLKFFREVYRILKPSGFVIIGFMLP